MTDSSIIKPFFYKIQIVNKKNSKQHKKWILFNYPKTRELGSVSCEGLMSLRDRILLLKVFESNHYTIILSMPLISPWLTMLFAQLL